LVCDDLVGIGVDRTSLLMYDIQPVTGAYGLVGDVPSGWFADADSIPLGTAGLTHLRNKSTEYVCLSNEEGHPYFLTDEITINFI